MTKDEINEIVRQQKDYFKKGNTLDATKRREKLILLKKAIKKYEDEIINALKDDLGKSPTESYMCEIGMAHDELNFMIKHVLKLSKPRKVKTPLAQFPAKSFQVPSPYGVVLVMSPWNYPFLLSFDPIIEAYAAGNTVLFKPSRYSKSTNLVMKKIIEEVFDIKEVAIVFGGREENQYVIDSDVDYIFFTGGKTVGKIVYETAAKKMIPVTLGLGGKSPCIVDSSAKLRLAAKRIVFGKLLNAGQTCIAPDYILVEESIKDQFIFELKNQIIKQYGNDILNNDAVMKEEIFGPIFPIMIFKALDEVIEYINENESPLAFYYFSTNKKDIKRLLERVQFGTGKHHRNFRPMLGDYLVIAIDNLSIFFNDERWLSMHGSVIEDEMMIPLIIIDKNKDA